MAQPLKGELLTSEQPPTPAIAINLNCIPFATLPQNGKASEIVYLKNVGREALIISNIIRPVAPFSMDDFDLPLTIHPGKKISFVVTVKPVAMGDFSGALQISSNDPNNPTLSIAFDVSVVEPEDEFAEKRVEMQKRAAKEAVSNEAKQPEEIFADWVTPLKENRESQVKNYILAFLLFVLLAGGIFYKYRTAAIQAPNRPQARKVEPAEPNPQVKEHLEQTDTVKKRKIILNQPNSYESPVRKP